MEDRFSQQIKFILELDKLKNVYRQTLVLHEDRQENDALMDALYYLLQLLLEKEYPVQLFWIGVNNEFRSQYIAETGEMEAIISEILSGSGLRVSGSARERMEMERPQEGYILVQTGAYKGAYIR